MTDSAWILNGKSLNRYKSKEVNGLSASRPYLQKLREELLKMTGLREPPPSSLSHGIKDMLGHQLGLAAFLAVMDALGAESITACGTGLRFGLAYAFLHKIPLRFPGRSLEGVGSSSRADGQCPVFRASSQARILINLPRSCVNDSRIRFMASRR